VAVIPTRRRARHPGTRCGPRSSGCSPPGRPSTGPADHYPETPRGFLYAGPTPSRCPSTTGPPAQRGGPGAQRLLLAHQVCAGTRSRWLCPTLSPCRLRIALCWGRPASFSASVRKRRRACVVETDSRCRCRTRRRSHARSLLLVRMRCADETRSSPSTSIRPETPSARSRLAATALAGEEQPRAVSPPAARVAGLTAVRAPPPMRCSRSRVDAHPFGHRGSLESKHGSPDGPVDQVPCRRSRCNRLVSSASAFG